MSETAAHLILRIETRDPIELGAFVGAFTSLGNEFERFVREEHPDIDGDVKFFVREVRKGSIEADIFPMLVNGAALLVATLDQAMVVEDFARRWAGRLRALIGGDVAAQPQTKSELKDYLDAVTAIATDPVGSSALSVAIHEDGTTDSRSVFVFNSAEARKAIQEIGARRAELESRKHTDHERVLMVFTRPDINESKIGKRSGELVRIEAISDRPLALMYGSALAEQRIKYEMRETTDNIFRKGFVVDVNVQSTNGRAVAYSVTNVHQIIDID